MPRHALIAVDPDALTANAAALRALVDGPALCAVVKADGYGHGSIEVARAALAGGATWLAVALVEEGHVLRDAGIDVPVLVLSEPPPDVMAEALDAALTPTLYTHEGVDSAIDAVRRRPGTGPWQVHLKVDTGMHRVGAHPRDVVPVAERIARSAELDLGGTFTHLAVADEPERPETEEQLDRFEQVLAELERHGIDPGLRHAANSAGAIAHPRARYDLVRVGIALYGVAPAAALADEVQLAPAMSLRAEVTLVKQLEAGDGVSYGLRHVFDRPATVAVVPLGYADGVPRRLGTAGGQVLIGGVRRPIRGVVTMDQLIVEVTDGPPVLPGDPVVLLGDQGDERITAQEWADRLDTIPYEVICGFSVRLPREICRSVVADPATAPAPTGTATAGPATAPATAGPAAGHTTSAAPDPSDDPAPTDELPVMSPR
jgi:alanine racemase